MSAAVEAPPSLDVVDLKPCEHQAGGHFAQGKDAATFVDESGKFYKALQDEVRGAREAAVYELIFGATDDSVRPEDMEALRKFVPRYYGTLITAEKKLLAMENSCAGYTKPCVLDAKLGFTTAYDWMEEKNIVRNRLKDQETTQVSLGFRVTGFKVWDQAAEEYWVADRKYGKALTPETMPAALERFGRTGPLTPKDVYGGEAGALAQVRQLQAWFETQTSLVFFAASVIIIYEGAATRPEDANVRIRFIDFAHTYPSKGKRDENVLPGVKIFADLLEKVAAEDTKA